ncbi:hypothetical protein PIB30_080209 [Stylosanthes scabra]|uniref:Homeobox-leucine zipper protein n=1 Tax=Stylosanthes scabra TaxID=79078 RepID=A0ABU6VR78_9FABA|nr:hypothetical protein [Stylosanthes scabra]
MKRIGSSDSLGALITICPSSIEEQSQRSNHVYGGDPLFQSMVLDGLEEEGCTVEESGGHQCEKKRRLSVEQVKALEKNFEVQNKLEPERKVKLAQQIGLQPRQVAVWFQNRRARWKTKQLERDYGVLKNNYEVLKVKHDALKEDNDALHNQMKELKTRLQERNTARGISVKEEEKTVTESKDKLLVMNEEHKTGDETSILGSESRVNDQLYCDKSFNDNDGQDVVAIASRPPSSPPLFLSDFNKDGSSDSDSSAILNEDTNNNNCSNSPKDAISSLQSSHHFLMFSESSPLKFNGSMLTSSSSMNCLQFQKPYQNMQFGGVKMEEHNFIGGADEACNLIFSDEPPPTLHWCSSDKWG